MWLSSIGTLIAQLWHGTLLAQLLAVVLLLPTFGLAVQLVVWATGPFTRSRRADTA